MMSGTRAKLSTFALPPSQWAPSVPVPVCGLHLRVNVDVRVFFVFILSRFSLFSDGFAILLSETVFP